MESPANHDVAPAVTSLQGSRDDNNNMAYARRCVVMEIIKAETDYVTHLHDVVQVKSIIESSTPVRAGMASNNNRNTRGVFRGPCPCPHLGDEKMY